MEKRQPSVQILAVEDCQADANLLKLFLGSSRKECELYIVRDGSEALDYLHRRSPYETAPRPDLVLLDLNLPKKSGTEVLREIRETPSLHSIPVVIFSTSDSREDIERAYALAANSYLVKPNSLEELDGLLKSLDEFWLNYAALPRKVG